MVNYTNLNGSVKNYQNLITLILLKSPAMEVKMLKDCQLRIYPPYTLPYQSENTTKDYSL